MGYTAGSMVYYNDIANYTNEAGIKQYKGLKRGDYINNYLTEIKKYHFHDTGKTSPFTKESHIQNDRYYLYEKEIIWLLSSMLFKRKLRLCTIVS